MTDPITLSYFRHERDSAGRRYVYPVLSRRAKGISLGINLNTNSACNWACLYCQVENLQRGKPEAVDIPLLSREFRSLLTDILAGDLFVTETPAGENRLVDVAFSGNGEPTSAPEFCQVVDEVYRILDERLPDSPLPLRLITNGSLLHRQTAQEGIRHIGQRGGEVWFKVDRLIPRSSRLLNGVTISPERLLRNLARCAELATTWVQTCWVGLDGEAPGEDEKTAYLNFLVSLCRQQNLPLRGVLLYGMARTSAQPGAQRLSRLPEDVLADFAQRITEETGLEVRVSA